MTQIPAGWYPDPDPNQPEPRGQRYWDGQNWTDQVNRPAPSPTAPAPTQAPTQAGQAGQRGGYVGAGPPYLPMETNPGVMPRVRTTPDGEELAGWGRRGAALIIDYVIINLVTLALAFRWYSEAIDAIRTYIDESRDAAGSGGTSPGIGDYLADVVGPLVAILLVGLMVRFVYHVGFLKWKQATPGKMALGMRVRLRERPGPMSWGTVIARWAGQHWYIVLSLVPVLGSIASLYPVLDLLWPLWDDKNQALHDKIAKTNVVRVR